MKNTNVHIIQVMSANDSDLIRLGPMVGAAFELAMEGCPEEAKGISLPTGEDLLLGLKSGMHLWKIFSGETLVGGAMISVSPEQIGHLELLFVSGSAEGKGIGLQAWKEIERAYPNIHVWETVTPCFQKRNIHFYVNKCGFHIVAYHSKWNPIMENGKPSNDEMFAFRKEL